MNFLLLKKTKGGWKWQLLTLEAFDEEILNQNIAVIYCIWLRQNQFRNISPRGQKYLWRH